MQCDAMRCDAMRNSSGYSPPFVKLGNLVRYTYEGVELCLGRQLELSLG